MLLLIDRRRDELDNPDSSGFVSAAREVLGWDEEELRTTWAGAEADPARAWEALGRGGEDVVELVLAGTGPELFAGMPGLTPDEAAAWRWAAAGRTAPEAVDRAVFFRSLGLGATPPENLYRLAHLTVEDLQEWIVAGFDVPTMVAFSGLGLTHAVSWRDHGYRPAEAQGLLQADSTLTAVEADAFAAAGIVGRHRHEWIRRGFGVADAMAYDAMDVQPNEARVWRSMNLGPADVPLGRTPPPGYQRGGWIMDGGMKFRDAEHCVQDPPGTRGSMAEQNSQRPQRFRGRNRPSP